jgi:phage gp36-like protein
MAYATVADLQLRIGSRELEQLTDIGTPRLGAVDEPVAAQALADASALIDGYLLGRYALPLMSPTPEILKVHACAIARFQLMRNTPTERAEMDKDDAIAYLTKVAEGKITLLPPSSAPAPDGIGPVLFNAGSKVMGREAY